MEIGATTYLRLYAVPPTVEITSMPGALDTLLPGEEYFLSVEIRNGAVPNLNPMQAEPPDRVDYAPYIKGGWMSINKGDWRLESPVGRHVGERLARIDREGNIGRTGARSQHDRFSRGESYRALRYGVEESVPDRAQVQLGVRDSRRGKHTDRMDDRH